MLNIKKSPPPMAGSTAFVKNKRTQRLGLQRNVGKRNRNHAGAFGDV